MFNIPDPLVLTILLAFLALLPFLGIMVTSFVKIVVVLLLLRNALGIQQIPPNMAINGLAIILSIYIMAPVGFEMYDILSKETINFKDTASLVIIFEQGSEPLKRFLIKHANPREREFFVRTAYRLWPEEYAKRLTPDSLLVLIPAFTVSELTSAFQMGFLIYLPFIAIDLIVSNILLAMGMMMLSPVTISLPFKLLLFVLIDGWTRLIQGLVLSYQ